MKTFGCVCGNRLHFENNRCLVCERSLGFLPGLGILSALEPAASGNWTALADGGLYRQCANYSRYNVCNWMVPAHESNAFCVSCRLNRVIPNLSEGNNLTLWARIETAKRRLLYTLLQLGLPVVDRSSDPQRGLAFKFMEDPEQDSEFSNAVTPQRQIITGHSTGIITINIMEAEPSERERMRERMNERYRTLLGHFRHEIGHYYWELLVRNGAWLDEFHALFGDEQADYHSALERYYEQGPPPDWQQDYVSAYASAHPWEDWAESWAHYLHMTDTLETAQDYGFRMGADTGERFEDLASDWAYLSVALNALNRSMGLEDAYPFVLSGRALEKLRFVHQVVQGQCGAAFA